MKKLIAATAFSLLALSCSDKLTESKVKNLVKDCFSKKPSYGTAIITTGQVSYMSEKDIADYQDLQKKGLLTIEKKEVKQKYFRGEYHLVTLTEKAKPYILESLPRSKDTSSNTVRLYTKTLDGIGVIQEIPAMNMAEVALTLKKDDKTPFYELMEADKTDFITKKIMVKKTENKGWIYCD